jgi:hypothetical protein
MFSRANGQAYLGIKIFIKFALIFKRNDAHKEIAATAGILRIDAGNTI